MQRIQSGVTDQYVYFLMVDATDLKTPETGVASITVYRSRNGGTATVMTTPGFMELSAANMPGWYRLLMDEDTTLDAGDAAQNMALHITATGCAPARLVVEIYRPPVSAGETLTVSSGTGNAAVQSIVANAVNASALATDAVTEIAAGIWNALTSGITTASTIGKLLVDNVNATISSRATQTSVDTVDDFLDTEMAAVLAAVDTEVAAIKAKTDQLTFGVTNTVNANITHVDEDSITGDGTPGNEWGPG